MTSKRNTTTTSMKSILLAGAGLMIVFFSLTACTTANYGSLKRSSDVTQMFESDQILSDHDYYYSGFQEIPYAIIAVQQDLVLYTKTWRYVKLTPNRLNQMRSRMDIVFRSPPRGAWIIDADGNRIGVWYSAVYATAIKKRQDNQIMIKPPKPPDLTGGP